MLIYLGVNNLAGRLGGLPLAIVIAGAFIRETGTSIREYLQYYNESWNDLQSQSEPSRHYSKGNMLQTWMISYHEVQKRDPAAAKLLALLAYYDNRDIWYELVKSGSRSPDRPEWFEQITSNGLAFKMKMKALIGFSLIEVKQQEESYGLHPAVQDWCLHAIGAENNINPNELKGLALISVGYAVPHASERKYAELQQRLLPHANQMLRTLKSYWQGDNSAIHGAVHDLGMLYADQGKLQEAEEMYQQALAGFEQSLGPNHVLRLNLLKELDHLCAIRHSLTGTEETSQDHEIHSNHAVRS